MEYKERLYIRMSLDMLDIWSAFKGYNAKNILVLNEYKCNRNGKRLRDKTFSMTKPLP